MPARRSMDTESFIEWDWAWNVTLQYLARNDHDSLFSHGPVNRDTLEHPLAPINYSFKDAVNEIPPYQYDVLHENETRILFLDKQSSENDITCSLNRISLTEASDRPESHEY